VWDSWQPFLGAPQLEDEALNIKRFKIANGQEAQVLNSFICVLDLDSHHNAAISPVTIDHFIRVSPDRLAHHAFTEVPNHMLQAIQSSDAVLSRIKTRLVEWWPDLPGFAAASKATRKDTS
jgi:hypothetical protein